MTITEALEIVIELAQQNVLHDRDSEHTLRAEQKRQRKALAKVGALLHAVR